MANDQASNGIATVPFFAHDPSSQPRYDRGIEAAQKKIVAWCKLEDLDSVLHELEGYGFVRDSTPVRNPVDNEVVGEFVGIAGKISDVFLIYLQQNKEVVAVEILK